MGSAKIIVVGGMYRSGSTWQFNVIKEALKLKGYSVTHSGYKSNISKLNSDYHIFKVHNYYPKYAVLTKFVFTSSRDINDISKSWEKFKPGEPMPENWLLDYSKWRSISRYHMYYKEMVNNDVKEMKKIVEVLGFRNGPLSYFVALLDIIRNIKPPAKGYDKETLFYSNHISK